MDQGLAPACEAALEEHYAAKRTPGVRICTANSLARFWSDAPMDHAEQTEPTLLRGFLSGAQIDTLLAAAEEPGVWPTHDGWQLPPPCSAHRLANSIDDPSPPVARVLRPRVQHRSLSDEHVVLYMHRGGWFQRELSALCAHVLAGMHAHCAGMLDSDPLGLRVRCIELHHYAPGGSLLAARHRDNGSALTMSVLLSDPARAQGGAFVTYMEGLPLIHSMGRGDAILFASEKLHNVSTVMGGVRQSLVIELWTGPTNLKDRFA
jgi:hypothetical protein